MTLPEWVWLFLAWSNGALFVFVLSLLSRASTLATLKTERDGALNGLRADLTAQITTHDARRDEAKTELRRELDEMRLVLFGLDNKNGMRGDLKRVRADVSALVAVFLTNGERLGLDVAELRELNQR